MDISLEFRKKMIATLMEALQESPFFANIEITQLRDAVLNSENLTYQQSKSQEEYMYFINEKLKKIKNINKQKMDMRNEGEIGYNIENNYEYERSGRKVHVNTDPVYNKGYGHDIYGSEYMPYNERMGPIKGGGFISPRSGGYGMGVGGIPWNSQGVNGGYMRGPGPQQMRYGRGDQIGRYGYLKDREGDYRTQGIRQREWQDKYYNGVEKEIEENEEIRRGGVMGGIRTEEGFYGNKDINHERLKGNPGEVKEVGYDERNILRGETRYGIVGDIRHSRTPEMRHTKSSSKMRYSKTPEIGCKSFYGSEITEKPRSPYGQERRPESSDSYKVIEQPMGEFQRKNIKPQYSTTDGSKGTQNIFNLPIFNDNLYGSSKRNAEITQRHSYSNNLQRGPTTGFENTKGFNGTVTTSRNSFENFNNSTNNMFSNSTQRNSFETFNSPINNVSPNPTQRNSFETSNSSVNNIFTNSTQRNSQRTTTNKVGTIINSVTTTKGNNSNNLKIDTEKICKSPKDQIIENHRDFFASSQPVFFQAETQPIDTEEQKIPNELINFLRIRNLEVIKIVDSDYHIKIEKLCEIIDHIVGLNPSEDALNKKTLLEMQKKYIEFPFLELDKFKEYFDKYESLNYTEFIGKTVDIFKEMKKSNKDTVIHLSSDEMDL